MSALMRKFTKSLTSTTQLLMNDDETYTLHLKQSAFKKQKLKFRPNEEFDEKTLNGLKAKSTIVFDDNVMIHTQHGENLMTIERRFFEDEMIEITKVGDVTATSWCKLVM